MRRVLVALGLLAVALGALWYLQRREESEITAERREAALLQFDERHVTALELTVGETVNRFEAREDGWWMTEPVLDRAEEPALAELMSLARRSPVLLTIDDPEPLDAYGLAPPHVVLRVEGGAEVPALRIGAIAPDGSGVYGIVEGRPGVLLVEVPPGCLLTHPRPEELRERSVSGLARTAIEVVEISGGGNRPISLRRRDQGWWIESPQRAPASDAAAGRLLAAVDGAEVVRVIDGADREDPAFGTGEGATVVTLGAADGRRRIVRIGHRTDTGMTYVVREDRSPVFVIRGDVLDRLPRSIEALGDVRLTKINRYRVREVSYTRGTERFEALRDDESGAWSSGGRPMADDEIYGFLVRTLEAPVRAWTVDRDPRGEPEATLTWTLADGTAGRARFWPGRIATVDSVEGLTAKLALSPPSSPAP